MLSAENRDLKCASDVSVMASLGRFDTEFLIYGSAVQEANGEINYYATTNHSCLYRRIQQARAEERYFLPVICEKHRSPVPSGMKEALLARYKLSLIQRMKRAYDGLLPRLQPFFQKPPNDLAYPLLCTVQDEIDGYFDETKLQLFRGLVETSHERKILSLAHYQKLKKWLYDIQRQMSDDPMEEGNITRTFYGFAYENEGKLCYVSNARQMALVEKRQSLQMQGHVTAPMVQRRFVMQQSYEIGAARKAFADWLKDVQDEAFMQRVQQLHRLEGVIDQAALAALADEISDQSDAVFVIRYFSALWPGIKRV